MFRCFGVSVFRCFAVSVFRCFAVSVFRCFVSVFRGLVMPCAKRDNGAQAPVVQAERNVLLAPDVSGLLAPAWPFISGHGIKKDPKRLDYYL